MFLNKIPLTFRIRLYRIFCLNISLKYLSKNVQKYYFVDISVISNQYLIFHFYLIDKLGVVEVKVSKVLVKIEDRTETSYSLDWVQKTELD